MFKPHLISCFIFSALSANAVAETKDDTADTQKIDEVITVTTRLQDSKSAPASITTISAEELTLKPSNDLTDLLNQQVGISAVNGTSGRANISIRGMDDDQTLILVNGKRISSSQALWRGGNFDNLPVPMNSIERVEIIRGPMSALYGSEAMGGVVNIITKAPTDEWSGNLYTDYQVTEGNDGGAQTRTNLGLSGPLSQNVSIQSYLDVYHMDAWSPVDDNNYPEIEEKQTINFASTLNWALTDNQTLEFDYYYNQDHRPLDYYSSTGIREQEIKRNLFGLSHFGQFGDINTTTLFNYEQVDIYDYNSNYSVGEQYRNLQENTFTLKSFANIDFDWNTLTSGFEVKNSEVKDPYSYTTGGDTRNSYALFSQDELYLNSDVTLTLGLRYDNDNVFGGHTSPRAYATYAINDIFTVKGGVSSAYKAPSTYQNSANYAEISCSGSCYIYGNPDLKPETSINYEIALLASDNLWSTSLTAYQTTAKNYISALTQADDAADGTYSAGDKLWENTDKVDIWGLEYELSLDISDNVNFTANYNYMETENKDTGAELTEKPKNTAFVQVNWIPTELLTFSASTQYTGSQWYGSTPVKLKPYTTYDLTSTISASDDLSFNVGIKNLSDVRIYEDDDASPVVLLGRSYFVSVNWLY